MIELIVIWKLATSIGNIASQKGLKKLGYQIMAVILWLCGELFGAMLGGAVFRANDSFLLKYLFALTGAVISAGIAFLVMRLLPSPELVDVSGINGDQKMSGFQKFGRSGCVPTLIIVMAVFCVGVGFIGSVLKEMMSVFTQTRATNIMVGTELNTMYQIREPEKDISSEEADVIYLSFDFETVEGFAPPVTIDWIVNGQVVHSTVGNMSTRRIVQSLNPKQLGVSKFPKGVYEVNIHIENAPIASVSFTVK